MERMALYHGFFCILYKAVMTTFSLGKHLEYISRLGILRLSCSIFVNLDPFILSFQSLIKKFE